MAVFCFLEQNPPTPEPETGETNRKPLMRSVRPSRAAWRNPSGVARIEPSVPTTQPTVFLRTRRGRVNGLLQPSCDQERSRINGVCSTLSFSAAETPDSVSFHDHDLAYSEQQVRVQIDIFRCQKPPPNLTTHPLILCQKITLLHVHRNRYQING